MARVARKYQITTSCIFHALNRGILRQEIFHDDEDYEYFLKSIRLCRKTSDLQVYHWCLMPNHYHLVVDLSNPSLISKFIGSIQQRYAFFYHKRYHTAGKLFQNRFKSQAIEQGYYFMLCGRYVELNPVRAGLVEYPWEWKWSSARFYAMREDDSLTSMNPEWKDESLRSGYKNWLLNKVGINEEEQLFRSSKAIIGNYDFQKGLIIRAGHARPRIGRPKGKTMDKLRGRDSELFEPILIQRIIQTILSYKSVEKIALFGSRTTGDYKVTSDIDIAIFAKDWTSKDVNLVKYSLEENIKTPLKFDVVNFYDIEKPSLKENILGKGKVIYDAGKN